jgi:hypothetical protein
MSNQQEVVFEQKPTNEKVLRQLVDSYLGDLYETAYSQCN